MNQYKNDRIAENKAQITGSFKNNALFTKNLKKSKNTFRAFILATINA